MCHPPRLMKGFVLEGKPDFCDHFEHFSLSGFPIDGCYTLETMNDSELLKCYAETRSEAAFTELVQRIRKHFFTQGSLD